MSTVAARPYGFNVSFRTPSAIPTPSLPAKQKSGIRVIAEHISRHKVIYRIGALTLTMLFAGGLEVLAEPLNAVGDATGIDAGAEKIYKKLVRIGKWIIIIKGAFDTISHTVQGDFVAARKSGLSYMLVYVILLGLPWAFKQIEGLFDEVI
jgi:hypothetical protein